MTENTTSTAIFSKMLRLQLIATVVVVIASLIISGLSAGISAFLGGLAVIIGAFFGAKIAQRSKRDATAVLINLLKAEAVKIIVIFALLLIVFKVYKQLVPFALIAMSKLDKTELEL
jgi:ATP synthase protein I